MATSYFSVIEHILPCQHIREYPKAIRHDSSPLRLAIKEYRPLASFNNVPGAVTIIATHGNGFPQEASEPLFDDMYEAMGGKIRSVWIADCSNQGASGVLNRKILGDDPSWFDHSRDLLCMINHFRHKMSRPIIGLGHSFGAAQLAYLSIFHPRFFHSLALIEPVIQSDEPPGSNVSLPSSFRRDVWPSRSEAESSLRANKAFKDWDPRALDRYLKYGLHEIRNLPDPTSPIESRATIIPSFRSNRAFKDGDAQALERYLQYTTDLTPPMEASDPVTLTTTKQQEVWTNLRSNFVTMPIDYQANLVAPDTKTASAARLFYRPEVILTFSNLPHLRPSVLWMFGAKSPFNGSGQSRAEKMERTGTGIGGSGGAQRGQVTSVILEHSGHALPLQQPRECALELAKWAEKQIQDFVTAESYLQNHDSGRSTEDYKKLSGLWLDNVRLDAYTKRADRSKL